jgi:hypothetical protein
MRADGPIRLAGPAQHVTPAWHPAERPPVWEPDTLFLLDPRDEAHVLSEGGRLADEYQDYFGLAAADKARLVAGPFSRLAVTGPAPVIYPVDGLLPTDEFTVTFRIRRPADTELLRFGEHLVVTHQGGTLTASWLPGAATAELAVDASDWLCVTMTWDGTTLALHGGGSSAEAKAEGGAEPLPVSGDDGGLRIVDVAELHVSRFARTPGGVLVHHGPAVTVDLGQRTGRDYPRYVGGVLGLYTGFRYNEDGVAPNVGTGIRDAQFRACAEAGMPLLRLGGVVSATKVGENGEYDFSIVDEKLDLLHELGVAFHITLDYNHLLTGAGEGLSGLSTPPNDYERYAELCSKVMAHLRERYHVVSVALWNEPDIEEYWVGSSTEFHELWRVVQQRFMQDHPDLLLTTADWAMAKSAIAHLEDIAAHGLPVAAVCMHTYAQDFAHVRRDVLALRATAERLGFPDLPIRMPEWGMDILLNQERYSNPRSVATAWPNRFKNSHSAAFAIAFIQEVLAADPLVDLTTFSSIGTVDHGYLSVAAYTISDEALLSSEDPPRPYPSFAALSLLWKLGGDVVAATTNWPGLRVLATTSDDDATTVVVFSSYRPWRHADRIRTSLVWSGLPSRFTWKQWQMDDAIAADGRLMLVAEGDETDLPLGVDLGAVGIGGFEITAAPSGH